MVVLKRIGFMVFFFIFFIDLSGSYELARLFDELT